MLQKYLAKGETEFRAAEGSKSLVLLLLPDKIKLRDGSKTLLKESYAAGGAQPRDEFTIQTMVDQHCS